MNINICIVIWRQVQRLLSIGLANCVFYLHIYKQSWVDSGGVCSPLLSFSPLVLSSSLQPSLLLSSAHIFSCPHQSSLFITLYKNHHHQQWCCLSSVLLKFVEDFDARIWYYVFSIRNMQFHIISNHYYHQICDKNVKKLQQIINKQAPKSLKTKLAKKVHWGPTTAITEDLGKVT